MKHIHQYKKQKIGRRKDYPIYRCMRPSCTHYVSEEFIEGRQSVCWTCDGVFTITHKLLRIKPICETCKKLKSEGVKAQPIEDFDLDAMLADMGHGEEDPF